MSQTLKIGALDLSAYVRVSPGEGYSPSGDGTWAEPSFNSSPFSDGEQLAGVAARNRQLTIPLYLGESDKDSLHALVAQINRTLAQSGSTVEWADEGATHSTYYNLVYGRFEPDFNYRRGQQNYGGGVVRLWVSPYGTTATYVAWLASQGAKSAIPMWGASPLAGDADAQAQYRIQAGGSAANTLGRIVGLAPLPHPSYRAVFNATEIVRPGGFWVLGSAPNLPLGSAMVSQTGYSDPWDIPIPAQLGLPIPSVFVGRSRVLAYARCWDFVGRKMAIRDPSGKLLGPAAEVRAAAPDWELVDLGILSVPSPFLGPASYMLTISMDYGLETSGFLMVPEDRSVYIRDVPALASSDYFVIGTNATAAVGTDEQGHPWITTATAPTLRGEGGLSAASYPKYGEARQENTIATAVSGCVVGRFSVDSATSYTAVWIGDTTRNCFDLTINNNRSGEMTLGLPADAATKAFPSGALPYGMYELRLDYVHDGTQTAYLRKLGSQATHLLKNSLGSALPYQTCSYSGDRIDGRPGVSLEGTAYGIDLMTYDFAATTPQASNVYTLSGAQAWRSFGGSAFGVERDSVRVGAIPNLSAPSQAGVLAFAAALPQMTALYTDLVSAQVAVKECFTYAR